MKNDETADYEYIRTAYYNTNLALEWLSNLTTSESSNAYSDKIRLAEALLCEAALHLNQLIEIIESTETN